MTEQSSQTPMAPPSGANSLSSSLPAQLPPLDRDGNDARDGRRLSKMAVIRDMDGRQEGVVLTTSPSGSPTHAASSASPTTASWWSAVPPDAPRDLERPSFSRRCKKLSVDQHEPKIFDVERIFMTCDIFRCCSQDFVRRLISLGGHPSQSGQTFDAEHAILHQGGYSQDLFVIHRGVCEVDYNGEIVKTLGSGEVFGEMGLFGLVPKATATVRTKSICHILRISATTFVQTLKLFPRERKLFEKEVAMRYRNIVDVQMRQRTRQHLKEVRGELQQLSTSGWQDSNQSTTDSLQKEHNPIEQQRVRRRLALSTPPHGPAIPVPEEEQIMKRLAWSLGTDSRRGFKMKSGGDPFSSHDDDEDADGPSEALDAKRLPPIPMLSAAQKQNLLRHLQHKAAKGKNDAEARLRRGMSKVRLGIRVSASSRDVGNKI
eukprot:gnl/MRDRNA2_/MRDRNA2_123751_c0_seq1.p1 gnl/MRDRNA2_/MRDRNA2_123751_c0~~gnl/MRDRNA2_/MRDRNA2_123751_c0_seq1.p1  ORF type:complete len:443 (-),score=87.59 gnl/MRDRNA2_/MRDRNA2_123751_c0_seq1:53-1345(-)